MGFPRTTNTIVDKIIEYVFSIFPPLSQYRLRRFFEKVGHQNIFCTAGIWLSRGGCRRVWGARSAVSQHRCFLAESVPLEISKFFWTIAEQIEAQGLMQMSIENEEASMKLLQT